MVRVKRKTKKNCNQVLSMLLFFFIIILDQLADTDSWLFNTIHFGCFCSEDRVWFQAFWLLR